MAKNINTKNIVKKQPKVIVDLTNAKSICDVYTLAAEAIVDTYMSEDEQYCFIAKNGISLFICEGEIKPKKQNIFKRFWNWLTRK